jgi:hypothetical protein
MYDRLPRACDVCTAATQPALMDYLNWAQLVALTSVLMPISLLAIGFTDLTQIVSVGRLFGAVVGMAVPTMSCASPDRTRALDEVRAHARSGPLLTCLVCALPRSQVHSISRCCQTGCRRTCRSAMSRSRRSSSRLAVSRALCSSRQCTMAPRPPRCQRTPLPTPRSFVWPSLRRQGCAML